MMHDNKKTIFLSYSRDDTARIQALITALEADGVDVWWDIEIPAGKKFADVIYERLHSCDYVVVVWSKSSVESDWVLREAEEGLQRNVLLPVALEDVDLPFLFKGLHTCSFKGWEGDTRNLHYQNLLGAIRGQQNTVDAARPVETARVQPLFNAHYQAEPQAADAKPVQQAGQKKPAPPPAATQNSSATFKPVLFAVGAVVLLGLGYALSQLPSGEIPAPQPAIESTGEQENSNDRPVRSNDVTIIAQNVPSDNKPSQLAAAPAANNQQNQPVQPTVANKQQNQPVQPTVANNQQNQPVQPTAANDQQNQPATNNIIPVIPEEDTTQTAQSYPVFKSSDSVPYKVKARPNLSLRASPSADSLKLGNADDGSILFVYGKRGAEMSIGGKKGFWVETRHPDTGATAFVFDAFLRKLPAYRVTARPSLRLRAKPNAEAAQVASLANGMTVYPLSTSSGYQKIGGKRGRWRKLRVNDKSGYVFDGFLQKVGE